jgi:hypothetical protein
LSGGRGYPPVQSTLSVQVSGSLHASVPITVPPTNQYTGNGSLHLPVSQLGPNVSSYPSAPSPGQTARSSGFDYSAPTNTYTGQIPRLYPDPNMCLIDVPTHLHLLWSSPEVFQIVALVPVPDATHVGACNAIGSRVKSSMKLQTQVLPPDLNCYACPAFDPELLTVTRVWIQHLELEFSLRQR